MRKSGLKRRRRTSIPIRKVSFDAARRGEPGEPYFQSTSLFDRQGTWIDADAY